ncbi:MAG: MerR family transcriptional regulator [Clostridia bacterium]|jgi:DNA-binding transcriptional MerR regulator
MKLSVSETAKIFDISVRTLHYYDVIGLLKPSELTDAGYRLYDSDAISKLQQILFYRELDLSLKDIDDIFRKPDYDRRQALRDHRELLLAKKQHIDELIAIVDETLGGKEMSDKKKTITDIKAEKQRYADEVRERWGKTEAYSENEKKHASYTDEKELAISYEADAIFKEFADNMDKEPSATAVQKLVKRWQDHITKYHYNCTLKILAGLGEMYVADERFTMNIDRFGDGTARFMSDAIKIYCGK